MSTVVFAVRIAIIIWVFIWFFSKQMVAFEQFFFFLICQDLKARKLYTTKMNRVGDVLPPYSQNGTEPSFCARYGGLKLYLYSNRDTICWLHRPNGPAWLYRRTTAVTSTANVDMVLSDEGRRRLRHGRADEEHGGASREIRRKRHAVKWPTVDVVDIIGVRHGATWARCDETCTWLAPVYLGVYHARKRDVDTPANSDNVQTKHW